MFLASKPTSAEGGCPSGYAPSGIGPGGVQGCVPLSSNKSGNAEQGEVWEDRYGAIATDDVAGLVGTIYRNAQSQGGGKVSRSGLPKSRRQAMWKSRLVPQWLRLYGCGK